MKLSLFSIAGLALAITGATIPTTQSAILYDLDSAVLDGGTGENTFGRGTGSLSFSEGNLLMGMAANSYVVAYFEEFTLANTGDKITLSATYSSAVDAFSTLDQALRIGLFNSGGNQVSANGGTSANPFNAYVGSAATLRARAGDLGSANSFYERTGTNNNLWGSDAYTQVTGAPTLAQVVTGGTTIDFSIERVAAGGLLYSIDYTSPAGAENFSILSATPGNYSFDSLAFFANPPGTTPTLTFSDLTITAVPEPTSLLMLSLAGGLLLLGRRRNAKYSSL